MKTLRFLAAVIFLGVVAGAAHATGAFQGRLADGTPSATCTVTGPGKCAMFYSPTLNATILNDWNIGPGIWSASPPFGSIAYFDWFANDGYPYVAMPFPGNPPSPPIIQVLIEKAGRAQTAFSNWRLPTGWQEKPGGPLNEYKQLYQDTLSLAAVNPFGIGLAAQFDGVVSNPGYWSSTDLGFGNWVFSFGPSGGGQGIGDKGIPLYGVAIKSGDVALLVPEADTWAMLLAGLGLVGLIAGRRRR